MINRTTAMDFIRRNKGKISQRKMAQSLSISPISVTRIVREMGMADESKNRHGGKVNLDSKYFSFNSHYELFIG